MNGSYKSIPNKPNNPIKNWAEKLNRHFSKEDIQVVHQHMKICSIALSLEKCKSKPQWHITSHLSEWLPKCLQVTNVEQDMEKREPSYTAGWNVIWCSHYGKHYGGSSKKPKNRTTIWSRNSTPGYIYEKNENPNVHSSIIYNSQDMEATQVSINRWMD